jgi:hypothetical protein
MPPLLATIGAKLAVAAGILVLLLAIYGLGRYHGWSACQTEHQAAIAQQALGSADTVIETAKNTGKVLVKYDKAAQRDAALATARAAALEKELNDYVQTHPVCPVPDQLVRVFDAPPADRLPAAAHPTTGAAQTGAALTTVELLRALDDWRTRYDAVALQLNTLIEWTETSLKIQEAGAGR